MPTLTIDTDAARRYRCLIPRPLTPDEVAALEARLARALAQADPAAAERAILDAMAEAQRRLAQEPAHV